MSERGNEKKYKSTTTINKWKNTHLLYTNNHLFQKVTTLLYNFYIYYEKTCDSFTMSYVRKLLGICYISFCNIGLSLYTIHIANTFYCTFTRRQAKYPISG